MSGDAADSGASRGLGSCNGIWVFVIAHAGPDGIDAAAHGGC
jgi:hypothetical protein